mgnify:FL=1
MPKIVIMQTGRDVMSPMVQVGNTIDISKSKSVEETMDKVKKEMVKGVVNDYTKHPHLKQLIEEIDAVEDMEQKYSRMKQCYIDLSMDTLSTKNMIKMDIENCMKIKKENEKLKEELECKKIDIQKQVKRCEKLKEKITKLKDDIEELKKPITNKDTRCPPFDVKVNVNYIFLHHNHI